MAMTLHPVPASGRLVRSWCRQKFLPVRKSISGWSDSLLAQKQIDYPTSPHMLARLSQMVQDVGVVAAGIFEGVGKDGEAVEGPVTVDAFSNAAHRVIIPGEDGGRQRRRRAE